MTNNTQKIDGLTLDLAQANKNKLKQLFPSVFTEIKNDKGELVESLDFDKLKAELGKFTESFENHRERYGMDWPGKKEVLKLIQEKSAATLKPIRDESVNFESTENLFIEGDNLEVLKLLQKSYYNKIKMIYIDPPYNTGKEFIYPDNFSESLDTYLEYAGLVDSTGKRFATNTANEGRFHTKWLNMMYPRLYLARNLLRDDGVIFISIDDNEVSNLRKLCDEIFGEENFIEQVVWEKMYTVKNDTTFISRSHEYVLIYAKTLASLKFALLPRTDEMNARYSNPDNDIRGVWKSVPMYAKGESKSSNFSIVSHTGKSFSVPANSHWRYSQENIENLINEKRIYFGKDGNSQPNLKRFLTEVQQGLKPRSMWFHEDVGSNDTANREMKGLFNDLIIFDFPKPSTLIIKMLQVATSKDSICLDFFAGSATTAHAVLDLNNQDGGNRKFIMVQLPEKAPEDSEAYKAGYTNIADIGKERIRRVIKKLNEDDKNKLDLDGTTKQDRGFKVLKLDKSNFKQWRALSPETPQDEIIKQMELSLNKVEAKATEEDMLYEIIIKAGLSPTQPIAKLELAGTPVYAIEDGLFMACLAPKVTQELFDEVSAKKPAKFICLDSAFEGNDKLKANALLTFEARNTGKDDASQIKFEVI